MHDRTHHARPLGFPLVVGLAISVAAAAQTAALEEPGLELLADAARPQPLIGIGWSGTRDAPADSGHVAGAVLQQVTGPAESAGLAVGDAILAVGGEPLVVGGAIDGDVIREAVATAGVGGELTLVLLRGEQTLERTVTLGARPPRFDRYASPAGWLDPAEELASTRRLLAGAAAAAGAKEAYEDTLQRLRRLEERRDAFRLRAVSRAHAMPAATEPIAAAVSAACAADFLVGARQVLLPWERGDGSEAEAPGGASFASFEDVGQVLVAVLTEAGAHHGEALAALTEEERRSLPPALVTLGARLEETIYLHQDGDPEREQAHRQLVAALERVRLAPLFAAAARLQSLTEPRFLAQLAELAAVEGAEAAVLFTQETEFGLVEICGTTGQTHTRPAAVRIDLGGNDRYRDVAARAADGAVPLSISVDLAGDDLYAATSPAGLAAAVGGVAILVDVAGDDQYLARRWVPAAALAGIALLEDRAGNDIYRAQELGGGCALVGAAAIVDRAGDDRYSGSHLVQGVGLARGLGAVVDLAGDDEYSCTGRRGSSYGTAGIFDGWGQGLGLGFRGITSGGVGLLHDGAGEDRYEGGNFSQGGGYFFGMGILEDGAGNDRYVGSRYSQAFAAHQAVGVLIERGGNDLYQSHMTVAHGLSWDETTVVMHDYGGDDTYEAGGFSLCRVAHNGVCLVRDDGGDDRYGHPSGPAGSSGNDYHGGASFGLFVDAGGGKDTYAGGARDNSLGVRQEVGVFLDLPAGVDPDGELDWEALGEHRVYR